MAATALAPGCSKRVESTTATSLSSEPTPDSIDLDELYYKAFHEPMANAPKIDVKLPLLDALWELDPIIRERFPGEFYNGIEVLGIRFSPSNQLVYGDYFCTPKNSVAFAWSGGDGEHYSFVVRDNLVDESSPVILTAPANSLDENHLLAENFRDFLCLGLRRGFFGLGQFAYAPEEALAAYGNPDWKPTKKYHHDVGFVPDERQLEVLSFVAKSLELEPLSYTPEEYAKLQERLEDLIEVDYE